MNPTACSSMEYGLTSIGSVGHTYSRNPSLTAPDPPSSTPIYNLCSSDAAGGDASVELTRWCSHTAAPVGDLIFVWRLPTDENIANGQSLLVHDQRKYRSMLIYTNSSISKPEDWECKPTPKKFFVWFYGTDEISPVVLFCLEMVQVATRGGQCLQFIVPTLKFTVFAHLWSLKHSLA
ncbi:hypothetical protein ZEAMMB73_Zm00001d032913 [Zea mays]|uniref:Uncharacterized protein n=1 Tax=Zea mays TaxID=4577 RepID=A0A1D6KUU1_MAIZE|nr:hypothetical protein ZEAMMB73_Zm00001d032913 [Zea mays]